MFIKGVGLIDTIIGNIVLLLFIFFISSFLVLPAVVLYKILTSWG